MADPSIVRMPRDVAAPFKAMVDSTGIKPGDLLAAAVLIGVAFMIKYGLEKSVAEVLETRKQAKRAAKAEIEKKAARVKRTAKAEYRTKVAPVVEKARAHASEAAFNAMLADLAAKIPMENTVA